MTRSWLSLGARAPGALAAERLQLHYGAWVLASVAHSLLEHEDDDSHTNLGIEGPGELLATRHLRPGSAERCGLRFEDLTLVWLRGDRQIAALPLPGASFADALAWADDVARRERGRGVQRREFPDFPASELGAGGTFQRGDPVARAEIGRWYANGLAAFEELRAREARLSPSRVWPHHFDLGALLALGAGVSVELGLSPGDDSIAEPYFYCTPDPEPVGSLPPLRGPGRWFTDGFTAVVLTGEELLRAGPDQAATAREYLRSALTASRGKAD